MNRLAKKQASVADVAGACVNSCKELVKLASTPGIQYKDQCKQLVKFAKSLLIPLEDLSDNIYSDPAAEAKAAADITKVANALECGLRVIQRCLDLGRLEALMTANQVAASFANVAQELQHALEPLDLAALGCDEITVRQASITLEQLRKVQAPFPEEQQRTLIQLRKLSEAMRVQKDTVSASADPHSAAYQLRDTVHGVLDGGEVRQLVLDREMLRQMHATAVAARNHVEAFFCDCLLDAVRELLPDDVEPAGADLRATVIVRAVEAQEVPDVAPEEELVAVLSQLVEALKVSLVKPSITRPSENHDTEATTLAPRRSPKEMEQLESERRAQMLSCLEELLAVSAEMPEHELPLPQADIVAELSAAGAAEPLVACLHVKNLPEARLHSAELLERMVRVQPTVANEVVDHEGVALCIQALLHPDSETKPKSIALKSGTGTSGTDTFTPRLRAALLLKAMCKASERARAALAAPPAQRKKKAETQAPAQATRRTGRASRLTEMIRASQQSLQSTSSEAAEAEPGTRGALSTVVQALAKVAINEAAAPAEVDSQVNPFKPRPRAAAVRVRELSDEELDHLQSGTPGAGIALRLMATAAETLEVLAAEQRHGAVVVAQGGLHAAVKALEWDLSPEINTACAMVVFLLASRDPGCLQVAIEAGVCDTLAEISASEHPEERAAAGRALSAVLHGAASSTTALPGLGARAAASAGQASSAPPFPDAAGGGGAAAPDLIAARRFRPGGGIPQSSLFPMLQIVAMQDVASSAVELEATLHALLTAVDGSDQRQAVLDINAEMEQEADPLRPFSVLTRVAVDLSGKCSDPAFQIIEKLCLDRDAMTAFGPRFRPFMEPEHAYVEGAMRRLSVLLNTQPRSQDEAAAALCTSLSDGIDLAVSAAVTHVSAAVRTAAVVFVGAFCSHSSPTLLQRVVKRDAMAPEGQPELLARLVALAAQPRDTEQHQAAAAALRAIVHGLPSMQRQVLEKLVSAVCSCETEGEVTAVATALHGCLLPPHAAPTACISSELKQLAGVQLGGVQRFITSATGCGPAMQAELLFLVMRLCQEHAPAVAAVRAMRCRVVIPSATGAPAEQDATGVEVLQQLLGHNCSEAARACACSVLGQVALMEEAKVEEVDIPGTGTQLSSAELQRMYEGDSEGLAQEDIAPRKREVRRQEPLRRLLYQQGALEPMLEALLDATAALQQRDGARDSSGGGGVAGGGAVGKVGGRRASVPKAVLQEAAAQTQSPKDAAALPGGDRLAVSQCMAVKAVVNMTFGEPEECQRVACQSLVKALKSGTPAKRLACAQVLQHTLAHQSGRVLLHGMQIIPALVALCSTGSSQAKRAAAEGLTNLAACRSLAAAAPPQSSSAQAGQASRPPPEARDINPKIDVQRAGALAPLIAMLRQPDEGCIQASANALYVLAEDAENRSVMQGSGTREALQGVLALAKTKPPRISHKTRTDCEHAIARMLA